MPDVAITCSRCGKQVEGYRDEIATGGFYDAKAWDQFANEGETEICDDCMWTDPRYIAVYGNMKAATVI